MFFFKLQNLFPVDLLFSTAAFLAHRSICHSKNQLTMAFSSHWAFMMAICFWEATFSYKSYHLSDCYCGSPPGVIVADTLSFNAKIGVVDF